MFCKQSSLYGGRNSCSLSGVQLATDCKLSSAAPSSWQQASQKARPASHLSVTQILELELYLCAVELVSLTNLCFTCACRLFGQARI